MKPILVAALMAALAGCSQHATLRIQTQPEGAYITELGSGQVFGVSPTWVTYHKRELLKNRSVKCSIVKGVQARWVSGATVELESIPLCGSLRGDYTVTLTRPPDADGLEKDLQFALQAQSARAMQMQAQAAQDAADAAMYSNVIQATQARRPTVCTSTQTGRVIQTQCR